MCCLAIYLKGLGSFMTPTAVWFLWEKSLDLEHWDVDGQYWEVDGQHWDVDGQHWAVDGQHWDIDG